MTNQQPKALLLDMDDTLISFDGVGSRAWDTCMGDFIRKYSLSYKKETLLEEIHRFSHWYWSDAERHRLGRADLAKARLDVVWGALEKYQDISKAMAEDLTQEYSAYRFELIHLFPGTIEALKRFREKGIRLCMVTNGTAQEQHPKIERFGLAPYFEHILIEGEMGFGKPDPRVFQLALKKLQLQPEDVWMVGDNLEWDVAAPQRLGIYAIWNDYRKMGLPEGSSVVPDRIIHEIGELILEAAKTPTFIGGE